MTDLLGSPEPQNQAERPLPSIGHILASISPRTT
jgi:hypothetical protein